MEIDKTLFDCHGNCVSRFARYWPVIAALTPANFKAPQCQAVTKS